MYKAKKEFLWYKDGDEIKESDLVYVAKWEEQGLIYQEVDSVVVIEDVKEEPSFMDKVKDVAEDLLDDGKLNDSNKKSGRPKRK
jgi:hypothetical protein